MGSSGEKNAGNNANYLIIICVQKIQREMQKCVKRKCKQIKAV